ncbi:MAG TPA: DUF4149 domain-containing protein [Burkholderiales bacterium]|nr:DUF4149 domain-containing protein [Burkholderiales bacterium]
MCAVARFLYFAALTLWVGGLWIVGFYAAPAVFAVLKDDHVLAGEITSHFFAAIGWIGIVTAPCLLAFKVVVSRPRGDALRQARFWIIVVMLALALIEQFYMQPMMAEIKAQALPLPVMKSALAGRFDFWHRATEIMYTIVSLLGAWLVYLETRSR